MRPTSLASLFHEQAMWEPPIMTILFLRLEEKKKKKNLISIIEEEI